jgi:hypothetical protein
MKPGASLMSGIPELVVLRVLAAREMYGYELARTIRETTAEALSLGEGVLYPALHAMESRGSPRRDGDVSRHCGGSGAASRAASKRFWQAPDMSPRRFPSLAERLLRAGVSPRRIGRLLGEIEAHFDDVVTELQASGLSRAESEAQAEARLGPDDAFVAGIIARPELRSWARRWPWVAFIVFPLLGFALLFALTMLVMVGAVAFSNHVLHIPPVHARVLAVLCEVLILIALWVAPVGAAGIACLLAAHRRATVVWPIIGCVLVALVGAMTNASFEFRTAPHGVLSAGIGYPIRGTLGSLRVVATLVTILVPFLWFMLAKLRGERTPQAPRPAID